MSKTIIVSNRLPVKIQKKENQLIFKPSEGGLATGLGTIYKQPDNLWIGWPGSYFNSNHDKQEVEEQLRKQAMQPVFLTQKEIKEFYEGFSNEILWPAFHYFQQYCVYNPKYWDAYVKVNQKFANEILKVAEAKDIIWIQDYQLLLLPALLRKKLPKALIGFFLHIPFPSYEILRQNPWHLDLLKGVLGSDLIGFHTYEYASHFLSSIKKTMGIVHLAGEFEYESRAIIADVFPMSIDYQKFEKESQTKKAEKFETCFKQENGNQKIVLSIDRLDYSKGIPERLNAFEQFLEKHTILKEKVTLYQLVVPSRDKVEKYKKLKEEIDKKVTEINSKYGTISWTPIHHFYQSFSFDKLVGLYRAADVALVTPVRDGMNLVCKEFIACKPKNTGVLVLSKFAGAAAELIESIRVNPYDTREVVEALYVAINMPVEEQKQRMSSMRTTVKKFDINQWVKLFMERLKYTSERQKLLKTDYIGSYYFDKIRHQFCISRKRLLFLDYDGTLVPFKDNPLNAQPDKQLLKILKDLSLDPDTHVVIISGRDKNVLEKWFSGINVELVAEHGVWNKMREKEWQMQENLSDGWKSTIRPILEQFVERTPQSFIEEKSFSLVWHYRKVERGLGEQRSRELINYLTYLIANLNIHVLEGDMVVEIKNMDVNKGKATFPWISKNEYDFILAVGDDRTDEDMFKVMPDNAITIKVREKSSAARYSVKSYKEVRMLLRNLCMIQEQVE